MTRTLSFLLVCLMLVSLLAACSNAPTTTTDTPVDTTTTTESPTTDTTTEEPVNSTVDEPAEDTTTEEPADTTTEEPAAEATTELYDETGRLIGGTLQGPIAVPFEETLELSWWKTADSQMFAYANDFSETYYWQQVSDQYNVNIDWEVPSAAAQSEQFALMITSQSYTDVIDAFYYNYTAGLDHAIEEEIIIPLDDYAEYFPNYAAIRASNPQLTIDTMTDGGHLWGFACIKDEVQGSWWGPFTRGDLLDKYNMEVPTLYAEWEDVLTVWVNNEPAFSNGAMRLTANVFSGFYGFSAGYNVGGIYEFFNKDGVVHFSALEQGYKDYITLLNDWYAKGLIERDFVSMPMTEFLNYGTIALSEAGYSQSNINLNYATFEGSENWYAIAVPQPKVNEDDVIHFAQKSSSHEANGCSVITTMPDEEKVQKICALIDQFYTRDGAFFAAYGTEGYTYNYDENGEIVFTDLILNNPDGMFEILAMTFYLGGRGMPGIYPWAREVGNPLDMEMLITWSQNSNDWVFPSFAGMSMEENEEFSSIMSDIQTYISENVPKFVIGDKPMSEYDAFVETIYEMGIEDAIALKQTALDRYLTRGN